MMKRQFPKKMRLSEKLRYLIMSMMIPILSGLFVVLAVIVYFAYQYGQISHNVNVSSEFSLDFKESLDLKMYHYTVGSSEQEDLPVEDVDAAIELAKSLQKTTVRKESQQSIENVLSYCDNLKRRMYQIEDTTNYTSRQQQLENNIYVLTDLIQEKMMNYIYYEAGYMAILQQQVKQDIYLVSALIIIFMIVETGILLYRAFHFTEEITRPISSLCGNLKCIGAGEFRISPVDTNNYEMEELDTGIQKMASQLQTLMDNIKEEEQIQHMTQLQLIQEQVNPHFLYNTLDTIIWLVEMGSQEKAVQMLTDLSVFFRTSLSKGKDVINLKEEMMHTKSYLDIQQVRYQDILDYEISLPKELENVMVPKLTLQPLTENALYHGVKEKRGKSKIMIECARRGTDVILTVSDNGNGIEPERLREIQECLKSGERVGFGMAAVHERIKLYCGEHYGLTVSSIPGTGTKVEVLLSGKID